VFKRDISVLYIMALVVINILFDIINKQQAMTQSMLFKDTFKTDII